VKLPLPRLIDLPRDVAEVTSVDHAGETDPHAAGLSQKDLRAIWHSVEELYNTGAYPAITFCLRRNGKVVLNRALGHAEGNGPEEHKPARVRSAKPDTPVCAFSATKAVTAVLTHMLAEDGGIRLQERVAHYLPEFAKNGKDKTTVSDVLAHRSGFPMFDLPEDAKHGDILLDWNRCLELICAAPPAHRRGPRLAYHAVTGGYILGEIIQRVTGGTLQQYLDRKLRQPLGMTYFRYGLPAEQRRDAAVNYAAGLPVMFPIAKLIERALVLPFDKVIEVSNTDTFFDAVIPAGNLYCTAEELSRFYQMLLDGGVWNGQRLLKPETLARITRPACDLQFDHTLKIPMRYSEGLMLGANPFGLFGPMTAHAYGHLGFMNILGWADPKRNLSAGLLVTGKAVLGTHLFTFGQMLTTLAWRCRA
jgi:CubicO group peptidase (beta-lactamase class C family)